MAARKPAVHEYHVYDERLTRIAGIAVIDRPDGSHIVPLTQGQASYLIDQGTIGMTPKAQLSAAASSLVKQFHGEKA